MATTLSYDEIVGTYKKGSVVRIKLVSFLTYNKVEFVPGPRLNLVCGPNGTGKSTILNAMCLGLGGEPKHLGRADDVREFIAHGKDRALVEIELAGAPGKQGHIFRRVMDRNKGSEKGRGKGASTFFSNGVQTTIKEIRKIVAEEYNISIDNLCTFLPQDRVGSFSGFNSKQLLEETEKSLSGSQHLFETHQTLVALEKELHLGGNNVETMEKKLKKLEADFTNMEREKERMEERQEALEHVELLEQKIMWLKYDAHRVVALEKKAAKEAAKEQLKDAREQLAPLQERASLLETHVTQNSARFQAIDRNSYQAKQEINKQGKKYESHATEMDDVANTLLTVDEDKRKAAREATVIREKLHAAEEHLETFPDQTDLQAQIEAESQEFRTHAAPLREKKLRYSRATQDYREADERVKEHGRVLGQINDEKMNRRQRVFRAFPNLNKIYDWVQNNGREFRRPVWGPVGCEVDIKTNNAAAYLEQHVANHVFKAFVVECKEDYDLLYKKIRQELNMPINILTVKNGLLQPLERMYSEQKYQTLKSEHGVMGYLDESFTAPDPIMQALRNEGSVHRVLVGGDETQNSLDNKNLIDYLNQPEDGSGRLKTCCIFSSKGDKSYKSTCSISRYSGKPSLRVDDVNPPRFLGTGVNPIRKKKIETDLADAEKLAEDLKSQLRGMAEEIEGATNLHNEARARYEATKMKVEAVKKVAQKVDRMRAKLVQTDERANADNSAEKKRLLKQVMNRMKSAITAIESHAEGHSQWLQATFQTTGVRINEAIYTTDYRRVNNELQQAKQTYAHLEQALLHAADQLKAVKRLMNATLNECRSKAPLMDDEGNHLPLKAKLEELPVENMDEAVAALEDAQAKANSIDDNPDVMLQYEKLKGEIVEIKDELENLADTKDAKLAEIRRHQEPWESALENSLFKVNTLFAVYMSELGCAGQIVLRKGDTSARSTQPTQDDAPLYHFDQWGVEIQVKFREKAKMSVLSAQRHSGGERSVSTIMYLMALQELMVSPFRCVDEINQGLDERNERLVFKRIVKNSTQPPQRDSLTSHSGQYFLITPKLLPNLTDMEEEAVTVHVITNGSYTFENPLDWNPDKFVETAQNLQSAQKKRPSREDDSIVDDEQSPEPADKDDVEREREASKSARKKKRRVS